MNSAFSFVIISNLFLFIKLVNWWKPSTDKIIARNCFKSYDIHNSDGLDDSDGNDCNCLLHVLICILVIILPVVL